MKLKLNGRRYLVEYDKFQEKVGSIIMPENASERSRLATVLAVGFAGEDEPELFCKPGDRILLNWYDGKRIHLPGRELYGSQVDEERHRIIDEAEVKAIVTEED